MSDNNSKSAARVEPNKINSDALKTVFFIWKDQVVPAAAQTFERTGNAEDKTLHDIDCLILGVLENYMVLKGIAP